MALSFQMTCIIVSIIYLIKMHFATGNYIDCNGVSKCSSSRINCSPNDDCIINCSGHTACSHSTMDCPTGHGCNITCTGEQACYGSLIQATLSTELYLLDCYAGPANKWMCENLDIYCPPNQFGTAKCHISGSDNGLTNCEHHTCSGDVGLNGFHLYAINGWADMDFTSTRKSETLMDRKDNEVRETTDVIARDSDIGPVINDDVDILQDEAIIYIVGSSVIVVVLMLCVLILCIVIICYYFCKKNNKNDSNPPPLHNVLSMEESRISINDLCSDDFSKQNKNDSNPNDFGSVITPNSNQSNGDGQDLNTMTIPPGSNPDNNINNKVNNNESDGEGDEELYTIHTTIDGPHHDTDDDDEGDDDNEELYKKPVHVTKGVSL